MQSIAEPMLNLLASHVTVMLDASWWLVSLALTTAAVGVLRWRDEEEGSAQGHGAAQVTEIDLPFLNLDEPPPPPQRPPMPPAWLDAWQVWIVEQAQTTSFKTEAPQQ